jgi:D-alanyl-D-alanine carboxypeptidase (penicillin-binding protein 5/6)
MNRYAKSLHLYNTHFADPIGLLDDKDYTTPLDLAKLTSVALKNKIFSQVVATKQKFITDADRKVSFLIYNLNKLLGIDGVNGVKTGYTDGAGQVLVTSKEERGHTIITVVMASSDRFLDTQELLGLISGNITYLSIRP